MLENGDYKIEDMIDAKKIPKSQYILGTHNGHAVIIKKGKFEIGRAHV